MGFPDPQHEILQQAKMRNARQCDTHKKHDNNINNVQECIAAASKIQKELRTKLKDLTDQKKEAGIPKIIGHAREEFVEAW